MPFKFQVGNYSKYSFWKIKKKIHILIENVINILGNYILKSKSILKFQFDTHQISNSLK